MKRFTLSLCSAANIQAQLHTCSGVTIARNSSSDGSRTSRRKIQQPLSEPSHYVVGKMSYFNTLTYQLSESRPSASNVYELHFHEGLETLDAPIPS